MVNTPFKGELKSGDLPFYYREGNHLLLGLIDALGHGKEANRLSVEIKAYLDEHWHCNCNQLLYDLNDAIANSIGAAISLAHINLSSADIEFAGVGNVKGYIIGEKNNSFVSKDGVVGQNMRSPLVQKKKLVKRDKVIFCSDGIQERFYVLADRQKLALSPEQVTRYIQNEFGKDHDDASCMVFEY